MRSLVELNERRSAGDHDSGAVRPEPDPAAAVRGRNIAFLDTGLQLREVSLGFAAQFRCSPEDLAGADFASLFGYESEVLLLGQCLRLLSEGHGVFCENIAVNGPGSGELIRVVVRARHGVLAATVHPCEWPHHDFSLSAANGSVLEWIAEGRGTDEIAVALGTGPQGVRLRTSMVMESLRVDTRSALVSKAYAWGVLDPSVWPPRVAAGLVDGSWPKGLVPGTDR